MDTVLGFSTKKKQKLKEPGSFKVILLNDNYTPMEFVTGLLMAVFNKEPWEAERLMLDIHKNGRSIVGCYTEDIAVTKMKQVHVVAEKNGFPLKCVVEKA
ncbi:MAG: ATP-dependent Clp protease adaptor ClpS [Spirochaetaceae bacterium]|jgi:ATP-dependent Clp protease adaptor protein ClpS|nr:ATP-dependent Clp protease adaptor ClpS [Spirochaetaceae bacterium]